MRHTPSQPSVCSEEIRRANRSERQCPIKAGGVSILGDGSLGVHGGLVLSSIGVVIRTGSFLEESFLTRLKLEIYSTKAPLFSLLFVTRNFYSCPPQCSFAFKTSRRDAKLHLLA